MITTILATAAAILTPAFILTALLAGLLKGVGERVGKGKS